MKRHFYALGLMLAATFTLTNCAEEIDQPVVDEPVAGVPFEIVASTADTKTVNDGLSTKWDDNDAINLFHAVAGSTEEYGTNDKFTIADVENGRFTGTLTEALEAEGSYDWYALYPYNSNITTPGEREDGYTYIGHSKGLDQDGYDSKASLKETICPLYGVAKSVASSETPSITMEHLTSVVAIKVTNETENPLTITEASLTAEKDIVGSYYIDITKNPVVYTASQGYVSNTAVVNVSNGTALNKGESATLYLAIKPFTAAIGEELTLSVNGYSKPVVLEKEVKFKEGVIKTIPFAYDKVEEPEQPSAWVLTDLAEIKTGDQVVIVSTKDGNSYAMSNDNGTSSAPSAVKVTYSDNMLSQAPAENLVWSFEVTDNQYSFYKGSDEWLYCTNANNGVRVGDNANKLFKLQDSYLFHVAQSRYLGVYNSQDWRCYTSINTNIQGQTFLFFVKTVGIETPDVPMTPELAVDPETVNVVAAGGNAEFGYTVTNPTDGVSVSATTTADWISEFNYTTANKVTFTVEENTSTEAREAVITLSYTGAESKTVTVNQDAAESSEPETPGAEGTYYVKVTSAPTDWSGTYLIVYESGNVAFNGALTTLDAASNTVSVTISDDKIEADGATKAASFTINASGHIQSASGYYIGQTSNANGLKSSTTTTYENTLSLNSDGTVNIVSGGAYLRYNATSGQERFRYYKSSSYTGQKSIALYKLQ